MNRVYKKRDGINKFPGVPEISTQMMPVDEKVISKLLQLLWGLDVVGYVALEETNLMAYNQDVSLRVNIYGKGLSEARMIALGDLVFKEYRKK